VTDLPYDLAMAISHATSVLSWFENLSTEEMPPQWMWPIDEEITRHFERIRDARSNGTSLEDDDGPMLRNEYARNRGANAR
jgi:hypothetical protein